MTFKHMKFEDSPTMRALEKVAKEKGLVKPETLQKSAAVTKKADYTPTANLMENIFKLAAGLRAIGLTKEATEVETNYLKYKQAQTLYETSKEKGEDVLQEAHPKGSHKLEGVDGEEATVEDIIDQHLKMMKVVEKKPTGKLSEAKSKDILKAVRIALAGTDEENTSAAKEIFISLINETSNLASRIMRNEDLSDWTYHSPINFGNFREDEEAGTGVATGTTKGHMEVLLSNLNELAKKGPSQETTRELQKNINTLTSLIRDADNIDPVSRSKYSTEARGIYTKTPQILSTLRGEAPAVKPNTITIPEVTMKATALAPLFNQLDTLKNKVSLWKSFRSVAQNQAAMNWIKEELEALEDINKRYMAVQEGQEDAAAPHMKFELNEENNNILEFEKLWIKPAGNV